MYKTEVVSKVSDIPEEWNQFSTNNIFLSRRYLEALSFGLPNNIHLKFILIKNEETLVGIALIQLVKLYVHDTFREKKGSLSRAVTNFISYFLKGEILVVGNLTQTGQHGISFDEQQIDKLTFLELIYKSLEEISSEIKKKTGKTIRINLLKDFFTENPLIEIGANLERASIYKVNVQPNMILNLKESWTTFNDYYLELNKKYKRRYRTARKKLGKIDCRELTLDEIEQKSGEIHNLYRNVSDSAKFNTFLLPDNHFLAFKKHLGNDFRFFGYFLNNRLIAFHSLILNHENLETYFLGYDDERQSHNQLYLNMLYNMLEFGIENKFKEIVYARTAMEIKSSIGAKPHAMELYIMHTHPLVNRFMKPLFKLLDPTEEWRERRPFA